MISDKMCCINGCMVIFNLSKVKESKALMKKEWLIVCFKEIQIIYYFERRHQFGEHDKQIFGNSYFVRDLVPYRLRPNPGHCLCPEYLLHLLIFQCLFQNLILVATLPRTMADKKNEYKSHAHSRQVVFKNPPAFVTVLNGS